MVYIKYVLRNKVYFGRIFWHTRVLAPYPLGLKKISKKFRYILYSIYFGFYLQIIISVNNEQTKDQKLKKEIIFVTVQMLDVFLFVLSWGFLICSFFLASLFSYCLFAFVPQAKRFIVIQMTFFLS